MTDTTPDPELYRAGAAFVEEHASHVPNLWVSVQPNGITVQPHPSSTLTEQFEALLTLAQRLGLTVTPSEVHTASDGHRYYSNDIETTYRGVRVRGFQHVRVDMLVAS